MEKNYINLEVCGETAIKPYYYMRNGLLHIRYTVDRCVELSEDEAERVKADLIARPYAKQEVLADAWNFFTNFVGKQIIKDGCKEVKKRIDSWTQELKQ